MKKVAAVVMLTLCGSLSTPSSLVLAAQYTFIPRLLVDSYFTDNLNLTADDTESDIVTSVIPGFTAGVSGQTAGVDLRVDPGYVFYANNSDRDYWRLNAGLNSFVDITRNTTFTLTDTFYLTQDPDPEFVISDVRSQEPDVQVDPSIRQGQDKYWRNTFRARADHQFGVDDSVYAEYVNRILRNDNEDRYQDNDRNIGRAGLTYYFGPKWGVQLDGEYQVATYDRSDAYEGIPSSDFQVWAVEGRLIRRFSRIFDGYLFYRYGQFEYTDDNLISVPPGTGTIVINEDYAVHDARIGFTYNVAADMALDAYGGWALKVNDITDNQDGFVGGLTFRQTLQRGGYRIEAIAGYEATQQRAVNLGFERYYGLGFTGDYALTRHLTGDAYAAWRRSEYIDTIPERIVDRYRAGAGLAWQPYPWGRIRLAYLFRTAFSGIESEEYTENRIYLTLSLATELPYRALF